MFDHIVGLLKSRITKFGAHFNNRVSLDQITAADECEICLETLQGNGTSSREPTPHFVVVQERRVEDPEEQRQREQDLEVLLAMAD